VGGSGSSIGNMSSTTPDQQPDQTHQAYDGVVTVGGPPQVRAAGALTVTKQATGPLENNCYLLADSATGERLLVDASGDAPVLLGLLAGSLEQVLTTHRHDDHWQALAEVVAATGARTLSGTNDAEAIPVPTDVPLFDGAQVMVGHQRLTVIELVGHTPGGVALLWEGDPERPHLFTGDSLFPGGPGRTTTPEEFGRLLGDLESKVFAVLPDQTWVYPGHGADTTLGAERASLPEWRARGW